MGHAGRFGQSNRHTAMTKRMVVFGATGRVGREVVKQAVADADITEILCISFSSIL